MGELKPDVQALIMRALELSRTWRNTNGDDPEPCEVLLADMTAALVALSALSGEAETEWGVRAKGDSEPWSDVSEDLDWLTDQMSSFGNGNDELVSRRKAGEWEVVV